MFELVSLNPLRVELVFRVERRARWALAVMRFQQWRVGRLNAGRRADLLRLDEQEVEALSFAGR